MDAHHQLLTILESKGLIRIGELSQLSGRIGIDTDSWFSTILPTDPNSEKMGSVTMSLRPTIQSEVLRLSSLNLIPVFVYPGIPLGEKADIGLNKLWSSDKAEVESYLSSMRKAYLEFPQISSELFRFVGCETCRSAYYSSAQLAYLQKQGLVSYVMGKTDLLFYSVPLVIVEIMQTRYKYIIPEEVFQFLKIGQTELKQAFILCGYSGPLLTDLTLENLLETLQFVRLDSLTPHSQQVNSVVTSLTCSPVLSPVTHTLINETFHPLYGQQLNHKSYSALFQLNLSSLNFILLSHKKIFEKPPVADSNNYRRLLRSLADIKSTTVSLLGSTCLSEFLSPPIKVQYWFSTTEDDIQIKPLSLISWKIIPNCLKDALLMQKKNFPDLQFCLKWHMNDFTQEKNLIADGPEDPHSSIDCVLSKVLFTFLECIGYIFPNGVPTLFGNSFQKVDPEWQNSAFYLHELLKYGMLNGRTLSQSHFLQLSQAEFEKNCAISIDDSSRHAILLISRVFSLVQPTLNEEVWTGEVDYDLAKFHSLTKAIFTNYQQLFEAIIMKEFVSVEELKNGEELVRKSPLFPIPNPALGIAVKRLLILNDVEKVAVEMPHMADLFLDLQRGWMFWKNFVKVMGVFKQFNAVPESNFIDEIKIASQKLKSVLMRARIQITN